MPAPVLAAQPDERVRRARVRTARPKKAWRSLALNAVRGVARLLTRLWRRLARKSRFRLKVAIGLMALTAPLWTLNLLVAFLGHSVVFPLSPYFLRQKLSALGSYARHRPKCLALGHETTALQVKHAETRYRLPRGLLAALVQVESGGFPHRISFAGAMGPGQLMPDTARELGVNDPFDTAENVDGAGRLLAGHLRRFHDLRLAVAAYNAGPGAVRGGIPNNGQTPAYVVKVMNTYVALRPSAPPRPHPSPRRPPPVERGRRVRGPALATTELRDESLSR